MATPKLSFDKGPRQYYAPFNGRKIYFGKDYAHCGATLCVNPGPV